MAAPSTATGGTRLVHLAGAGACLVILTGASALGVVPALRSHNADQQLRDQLTAVTRELESVGDAHEALVGQVVQAREAVSIRDIDIESPGRVNHLMAELTEMFESMGFALQTLQPGAIEPGEPLSVIPIQVAVAGDLDRVLSIFDRLSAEHPSIHVHGLSLDHAGPETVRVRAEFRWHVLND